jgi:hypothetical protein
MVFEELVDGVAAVLALLLLSVGVAGGAAW